MCTCTSVNEYPCSTNFALYILYKERVKVHANNLCQLRSGINRLDKYLARIDAVESEQWKCGPGEEDCLLITF